jgi:hypothetical protein
MMIQSDGVGEFDSKGGDGRRGVPFSCRLEDATSGNTQQLEAKRVCMANYKLLKDFAIAIQAAVDHR